jgi:DnaJ-class molecular chaperone
MNKPQNCGTTHCSCIKCVMEEEPEDIEEDDEDEICSWCSGSGEGMYDGSTCNKCHGSGVEPREKDDDY